MYLSRIRLRPEMTNIQLAQLLEDRVYGLHRLFWGLWGDNKPDTRNFLFREEVALEQGLDTSKRIADPVYYLLSPQEPDQKHPLFEVQTKTYNPLLNVGDKLSFKLRVNPVVMRQKRRHDIAMNAQYDWLHEQLALIDVELAVKNKGKQKRELKHLLLDYANDEVIDLWKTIIEQGALAESFSRTIRRSELLEFALKTVIDQAFQRWWQKKGTKNGFDCVANDYDQVVQVTAYQKHAMPEKGKKAGFNSVDLTGELIVTDVELFNRLLFDGIGPAKAFGCGLMMIRRAR